MTTRAMPRACPRERRSVARPPASGHPCSHARCGSGTRQRGARRRRRASCLGADSDAGDVVVVLVPRLGRVACADRVPGRHKRFARKGALVRSAAGLSRYLVATATVLELPPIGSSHAPTSCLCTGCIASVHVALLLVVRSERPPPRRQNTTASNPSESAAFPQSRHFRFIRHPDSTGRDQGSRRARSGPATAARGGSARPPARAAARWARRVVMPSAIRSVRGRGEGRRPSSSGRRSGRSRPHRRRARALLREG
jgi:hypothetical protein